MACLGALPAQAQDIRSNFSLEARSRYEGVTATLQDDAEGDGYLWLRLLLLADLQAGPARIVVEPIAGYARGVNGGNGPADQTGVDLLQSYAELRLPVSSETNVTLRGGRELVALGSERLIGKRYGPNIPQAFDGFHAIVEREPLRIEAMHLRPTVIGSGSFDDRTSQTRNFSAVYATLRSSPTNIDLYWIGYRNSEARFGGNVADERRQTFGLRLFGQRGRLAWNWEAMIQRGSYGKNRIRAWSLAAETNYSFPNTTLKPRLRLRTNYASGDSKRGDNTLGTFNAMFPKGKYFGELTPIGPRNIFNINPGIDFAVGSAVTIELSTTAFWRASLHDGIYDVPGNEIMGASNSRARYIGAEAEANVAWTAGKHLSISGSLAVFTIGPYLRESRNAKPIYMVGLETKLTY